MLKKSFRLWEVMDRLTYSNNWHSMAMSMDMLKQSVSDGKRMKVVMKSILRRKNCMDKMQS